MRLPNSPGKSSRYVAVTRDQSLYKLNERDGTADSLKPSPRGKGTRNRAGGGKTTTAGTAEGKDGKGKLISVMNIPQLDASLGESA